MEILGADVCTVKNFRTLNNVDIYRRGAKKLKLKITKSSTVIDSPLLRMHFLNSVVVKHENILK